MKAVLSDGTVLNFPDGTDPAVVQRVAKEQTMAKQAQSQPSVAGDVAASAGSGLSQGVMDLLGTPGTVSDALNNLAGAALRGGYKGVTGAINAVQGNGFTPEEPAAGSFFAGNAVPPSVGSGQAIRDVASDVTGGATEYQPKTTAGEYAQTAASFVPGAAAFGGVTPANILKYGVLPGVASEGAGQTARQVYPAAEPIARIAGALLAPAAIAAANKVISPMGGAISSERGALNDIMKQEGVDLTAGQQTGSKALRYTEGQLGGPAAQNFAEKQGEQFTGAIMKRIGSNATRATPEAIDEAGTRIGTMFKDLASRNNVIPDQTFNQELGDTLRTYVANTNPTSRIPVIENTVADLVTSQGPISGSKYQEVASKIGEKLRSASGEELEAYQGIRSALDDAMERSIAAANPSDLGVWKEARNAYRNLLVVEKAATGAGEAARHGIISPAQLRSAVVGQGKRAFARGQGDFADLARAGEGTMAALPDSGTANRLLAAVPFGRTIAGASAGAGIGSMVGLPMVGAGVGAVAPGLASKALLSDVGRRYLANQVRRGPTLDRAGIASVVQALIARGGQ